MTGPGLVLAAAALWGTVGPAQVWARTGDEPVALGAARILIGGVALALAAGRMRASIRPLFSRKLWPWLLVGAVGTGAYQAAFMSAVSRTGAALATAVALGVAPIATGMLAWLVDHDSLGARWALGTLGAVAGCAFLLFPGTSHADTIGVILGIAAGVCYGLYTVAAKQYSRSPVNMPLAVAVSLLLGGLPLTPVLAAHLPGMLAPGSLVLLAWLGLVATAAAYMFFVTGLERVPASTAGTLSLAEPLVAVALGLVVLGERLSRTATIGMILLIGGLIVVSMPSHRKPSASKDRSPEAQRQAALSGATQPGPGAEPSASARPQRARH